MRIIFILSKPAVAENIGLAIRAIKTQGFSEIRLVNPPMDYLNACRKTAYGCHDILENAQVYNSLEAASIGIDLLVGTTAKNRVAHHQYYSPSELKNIVRTKAQVCHSIGIVFGSEQNGLSKAEINYCDLLSTIPLATKHPSLNLSQAVLLYAYELSGLNISFDHTKKTIKASEQQMLKNKALKLLENLEVNRQPSLYIKLRESIMKADSSHTKLMLSFEKFLRQKLK